MGKEFPTYHPSRDPSSDPTVKPTSRPTTMDNASISSIVPISDDTNRKDSGALRICFEIENINGTLRSSNVFPDVMVVPDWNEPMMFFVDSGSVFVSASFLWGVFIVCAVI